jgi:SulP family sulfate permease
LIGSIVFLTQLPESVAFAFLAKMTPPVGLHSAWIVGLITAVFGGRPGMVSGAAGARATIIGSFLVDPARAGLNGEGVEIVFPAVIISGGLLLAISALGIYRLTKIIPESVMIGFLNGIGILIVISQIFSFREDDGQAWRTGAELGFMLLIAGVAVLIMECVPLIPCALSKLMPSSLLALTVGAVLEFALVRPLGYFTNTIRDVARITDENRFPIPFMLDPQYDLRKLALPGVPANTFTLAVLLAAVGSIETLLTAEVVTEVVKTPNRPGQVMVALGVANIITGFVGGAREGGCSAAAGEARTPSVRLSLLPSAPASRARPQPHTLRAL